MPELDRTLVEPGSIKGSQLLEPLFEFSGACSGCGETPYLKLLTQLVGDRLVVANATGCSSIYGGNLPTTPWACNADGRGPAWANSLFEDNAEFGLGLRLSLDQQRREALDLLEQLDLPASLKDGLSEPQPDEAALERARGLVGELKSVLAEREDPVLAPARTALGCPRREERMARRRRRLGLRHRLRRPRSRARLRPQRQGARAGHRGLLEHGRSGLEGHPARRGGQVRRPPESATRKKDLGSIAMGYGDVYVAQIALGGDNAQAVRALWEAEQYPGPALVVAYSHCIEHGIEMEHGMLHQKDAVDTGYWPLYRYDPRNEQPLRLDSKRKRPVSDFLAEENRFASLQRSRPETARELDELEQTDIDGRWARLELMLAGQAAPAVTD